MPRVPRSLTSSGIDILKLMPKSFPSSEPGSMMMSVTILTVRKLFSSRKKRATITTVATIESAEPGTVPSVKSRGTFLREHGANGSPEARRLSLGATAPEAMAGCPGCVQNESSVAELT